jgi:hypothetical protein
MGQAQEPGEALFKLGDGPAQGKVAGLDQGANILEIRVNLGKLLV